MDELVIASVDFPLDTAIDTNRSVKGDDAFKTRALPEKRKLVGFRDGLLFGFTPHQRPP